MGGEEMKKLDKVPNEVIKLIRTNHEQALLTLGNYKPLLTLPVREVRMKLDRPRIGFILEDVIVPSIKIYYRGTKEEDQLQTNNLIFNLAINDKPFPYGHIYQSSGTICLGGIFVPSLVSIYNPSQPLEAMFLGNDHNTSHGGGKATITERDLKDIYQILSDEGIMVSNDTAKTMEPSKNLIQNDAIWILSADVRKETSLEHAIYIMEKIFEIIFIKESDNK